MAAALWFSKDIVPDLAAGPQTAILTDIQLSGTQAHTGIFSHHYYLLGIDLQGEKIRVEISGQDYERLETAGSVLIEYYPNTKRAVNYQKSFCSCISVKNQAAECLRSLRLMEGKHLLSEKIRLLSRSRYIVIKKVGNKVGNKKGLNARRQRIITEMRDNPNITTSELHQILGISETAVENNLTFLKENRYVERVGSKKTG